MGFAWFLTVQLIHASGTFWEIDLLVQFPLKLVTWLVCKNCKRLRKLWCQLINIGGGIIIIVIHVYRNLEDNQLEGPLPPSLGKMSSLLRLWDYLFHFSNFHFDVPNQFQSLICLHIIYNFVLFLSTHP